MDRTDSRLSVQVRTVGSEFSLELPFQVRPSSYLGQLSCHLNFCARQWTSGSEESLRAWRAARYDLLIGYMYPTVQPPLLQLVGEAVLWLFRYDDYLEPGQPGHDLEYATRTARLVKRVLRGESEDPPEDVLVACLWRLRRRLRPLVSAESWLLCAEGFEGFVDSLAREISERVRDFHPDVGKYLVARCDTSGWHLLTALVELADGARLPQQLRASPAHQELRRAAGDLACTINDLVSLDKELACGERHNLVLIVQRVERCDLASAVKYVRKRVAIQLEQYFFARARFLANDDGTNRPAAHSVIARYVEGLEDVIIGSLVWSLTTSRYHNGES